MISELRPVSQLLVKTDIKKPQDLVSYFGAMQSQDFAAAKWAIGLRLKDLTDQSVEEAFNKGEILRTHVMRPTWHFVSPKDIRWLLELTAPRVHSFSGYYYRKSGLDKAIFEKSNEVIRKALEGGKQLNRTELNNKLKEAKIPTDHLGLSFTIMQSELEGMICSGPKIGKQFTYMLLDERVPEVQSISYEEALERLVKKYFQSHGPAQIQDFVWWSGLTMTDAKKGIDIAKLEKQEIDGKVYWLTKNIQEKSSTSTAYLLPPFDEYFVAYKDRNAILDDRFSKQMNFGGGMITGAVLIDGIIVGIWKRAFKKENIEITVWPFGKLTDGELQAIDKAGDKYSKFQGMTVSLKIG